MIYVLVILGLWAGIVRAEEPLSLHVGSKRSDKKNTMNIFLGVLSDSSDEVFIHLKNNLEKSQQFVVAKERRLLPSKKSDITDLYSKGFAFALFINDVEKELAFEWRLYDTMSAQLLKGKRCSKEAHFSESANALAKDVWQELMGAHGPFTSKLCYVKKTKVSRHKRMTSLCVCDYDGNNEREILTMSHCIVAPCWGPSLTQPRIFFSEFTPSNVRLMATEGNGRKKIIIDFDGTTAGVSFASRASDGEVVYGRSGGIWRYCYDTLTHKAKHTLIIKEAEACACPNSLSSGDVIYCAQGKIKRYNSSNGIKEVLVGDGYNVGPSYHEKTNKIVFSRKIKGILQLCTYSCVDGKLEQITFDKGNKTDPCWSPCGTWVAYAIMTGAKSRILAYNIKSNAHYSVTSLKDDCHYPTWSGSFDSVPSMMNKVSTSELLSIKS